MKAVIFNLDRDAIGMQAMEERINAWLAQAGEVKIDHAVTTDSLLIVFYSDLTKPAASPPVKLCGQCRKEEALPNMTICGGCREWQAEYRKKRKADKKHHYP